MNKKIVSKTRYIISMLISFIIWSLVLRLLNLFLIHLFQIGGSTSYRIYNIVLYVLEGVVLIPLCYINNRKKRVSKYEGEKTKIMVLIMFYIFLVFIGLDDMTQGIIKIPILYSVLILIKIISITFINELMFKRSMNDEEK